MSWSPTPLNLAPGLWRRLMYDLWKRGDGRREAGAFLAARRRRPGVVQHWIAYDDLDPGALRQFYVKLEPAAFGRLSELCSTRDLQVVADIHTHPDEPLQSESDRGFPMLSVPGHIALIAPRFARGEISPADVSFNVYQGGGQWASFFGGDAAALIVAPQETHDGF
jgi:hypothetical protein